MKVYLPLKGIYSDREAALDEIGTLTKELWDLKVLEFYAQNWIVDISKHNTSIMSMIETKKFYTKISMDELKIQIDADEVLNKTAKSSMQQQQNNHRNSQTIPTNHVSEVPSQPIPIIHDVPTTIIQNTQLDHDVRPKTTAYISHIDRPDRFYLQIASMSDELNDLQENIQIVAPSLPPLEDFSVDTRCIVRYSVDDQWYRAVIIDSDSKITSILFMDYGNTDTITDNSLIKSMGEFDQIPAYAIPCSLPLEAKDRNEWSEESCQLIKDLVDDSFEFEYVCKGKCNNFVKLYQGDRDVMQELIRNGYAIKLDTIKSGENCYVSHVNSISDFYIQMESDCSALEIMADYLMDESRFEVMTDIKEGVVCAAKFLDDGAWYRAKIKSHNADGTDVFFIDYGNSSSTNELRIIPSEIANGPTLAKYCLLGKPKDVQYWSDLAEQRFHERTTDGTVFTVDVISPGKQSTVDLIVNGKSIVEEIAELCDKYSVSALENTLQSNIVVQSETIMAFISEGTSPHRFYIQLESSTSELDRLCNLMESAAEWPQLEKITVGELCAALFDGSYYRAKILSLNDEGTLPNHSNFYFQFTINIPTLI